MSFVPLRLSRLEFEENSAVQPGFLAVVQVMAGRLLIEEELLVKAVPAFAQRLAGLIAPRFEDGFLIRKEFRLHEGDGVAVTAVTYGGIVFGPAIPKFLAHVAINRFS